MTSVAERLQRKSERQSSAKQVRLKLVYIDFWSALKLSFLVWLALGIVLIVAVVLVWVVLYSTDIFAKVDGLLADIIGDSFSLTRDLGLGRVTLFAVVVAALDTVVGTVLGALAALLYNLTVRVTGGLLVGFQNS